MYNVKRNIKISKFITVFKNVIFFVVFIQLNYSAHAIVAINIQPISSQIICPGVGLSASISVAAVGAGIITFQWKKDGVSIVGATNAGLTIPAVIASSAGAYQVEITDIAGTVSSALSYLNIEVTAQPVPMQTLVTGNIFNLSVTALNVTGFQWLKNGVAINGATSPTYSIDPVLLTSGGTYTVNLINSTNGGCASTISNAAVLVTGDTLYLKNAGDFNSLLNWGILKDGSGSNPINFTDPAYVFKVVNQSKPSTTANLIINGTLDLVDAILTIMPGTILNAGHLIQTGVGTLAGSNTSSLIVNGISNLCFTAGSQQLNNLTIAGGTSTLTTNLSIASAGGALVVAAGVLKTSDSLTLKSDVNGTAIIGNSAGSIIGKVTVERYIPARRAWRLMTAPVAASILASDAVTINSAWQEAAISSTDNPCPGYGTHITGGTIANGFDQSRNNASGLQGISGGSFVNISNTFLPITQYPAYFIFVRGNRAYDILHTTASMPALVTTLRTKGNVNQGVQTPVPIAATGYTVAGNPFASPIDFTTVQTSSTNIKKRLWVWDPEIGGTNGVGAYILLDWNGTSYTTTPTAPVTNIIQAGQAFFVQSNDNVTAGSLVIKEDNKTINNSNIPFGKTAVSNTARGLGLQDLSVTVDLNILNADKTLSIADGVLVHYNDLYPTSDNKDDAPKIYNTNENLAIVNSAKALSIQRRQLPLTGDTLKLNFTNIKNYNYQLNITTDFLSAGIDTKLIDNYLVKSVSVINALQYPFSINADAGSWAAGRFSVAYTKMIILPLKYLSVNASVYKADSVVIKWSATEETNIIDYQIEQSTDNINYTSAGVVKAVNKAGAAMYVLRAGAIPADVIFYRVKATDIMGQVSYSKVVTVQFKNILKGISISPNPVTGDVFMLSMPHIKTGIYHYNICSGNGQIVKTGIIDHKVDQPFAAINLSQKIAAGNYIFSLKNNDSIYRTKLMIVQQ